MQILVLCTMKNFIFVNLDCSTQLRILSTHLNYFILQSICKKVEDSEQAVEKLLKDVNRLKQEIKKKQAQAQAARK